MLEPQFHMLVHQAVAAGWSEAEVSEALLQIARNQVAGMLADDGTAADIKASRGKPDLPC